MPHAGGAVWCRGSAAVGGTGRRALRSYRGRTETPPAKLSACATCHAHGALPGAMPHAQNSHDHGVRALPGRRDGDIAPYRHYPRKIRTPLHTAHYPGDGRLPGLPARALRHAARGVRTTHGARALPDAMPHAHCPWRLATPGGAVAFRLSGGSVANGGYKPLKCQPKSL